MLISDCIWFSGFKTKVFIFNDVDKKFPLEGSLDHLLV